MSLKLKTLLRMSQTGRKHLQNTYLIKDWYAGYLKGFQNSVIKKFFNRENRIDTSSKKIHKCKIAHDKTLNIVSYQGHVK